MATKTIKAWINGAIQYIEVEDIVSPEQPISVEKRVDTLEGKHVVLYTEQTLADAQKEQARENIGALSQTDPTMEYAASEMVEDQSSVTVLDATDASVDSADNSAYFNGNYIVVEKNTYKLDKATMLSIPGKHLTGNGSVAWKDWDTQPQGWKNAGDETMLSATLKVRYADDPIYMSMKLPSEALLSCDGLVRAGMKTADDSGTYTVLTNMGGIYPVDYTALPDDVVICIGHMSLYTLSKEKNAKWKLFDKQFIPLGQSMFYLPWSDCGGENVTVSASKITVHDDHVRFALKRDDFAPSSSVSGSIAKCLHFWADHKAIELSENRAVIALFETWTETPAAGGNLYAAIGCDQKSDDLTEINQLMWSRRMLLSTEKKVMICHNISDALYDELRDTPNDPKLVFNDYSTSFSSENDSMICVAKHNSDSSAHPDIRELIDSQLGDINSRINQMAEVIQPMEVLVPGINLSDGVYEQGYFDSSGAEHVGDFAAASFRNVNYIPVEGGRTVTVYYDAATWNDNNKGKPMYIVQYDKDKNIIGTRSPIPTYTANRTGFALDADTAYIRTAFNLWKDMQTSVEDIKVAVYYIEDAVLEFVEYGFGSESVYGVSGDKVFLASPNGTTYVLSVSDDGTLSAVPMNPS